MTKIYASEKQLFIDSPVNKKGALIYRAISHPLRLSILRLIHKYDKAEVSRIFKELGYEQSVVSAQLKILRDARIVVDQREGRWVYYQIDYDRIEKIQGLTQQLLTFEQEHTTLEAASKKAVVTKFISFSRQEKNVIKLICEQYTNEEIATHLKLSKRTVESYRDNIIQKMEVKNTAGLVVYAIKAKLYHI